MQTPPATRADLWGFSSGRRRRKPADEGASIRASYQRFLKRQPLEERVAARLGKCPRPLYRRKLVELLAYGLA
jgi:hypothetical protein